MVALQVSIGTLNDLLDADRDAGRIPPKPIPGGLVSAAAAARPSGSARRSLGLLAGGPVRAADPGRGRRWASRSGTPTTGSRRGPRGRGSRSRSGSRCSRSTAGSGTGAATAVGPSRSSCRAPCWPERPWRSPTPAADLERDRGERRRVGGDHGSGLARAWLVQPGPRRRSPSRSCSASLRRRARRDRLLVGGRRRSLGVRRGRSWPARPSSRSAGRTPAQRQAAWEIQAAGMGLFGDRSGW